MHKFNKVLLNIRTAGNIIKNKHVKPRFYCNVGNKNISDSQNIDFSQKIKIDNEQGLSGFAKSFKKHELLSTKKNETFAELLYSSKFIDLGNPEGKIVTGKIYHVVADDLYIDFGWKFHCVCKKPPKYSGGYVKNAIVKLKIKDLESSSRFIETESDLTLLEAECVLLGLISSPANKKIEKQNRKI